ncbi:MAG: hypothetical protein E7358_05745 [Clostridiales bacterium]|nr:hypothetical protein [Clostridiales bacterium]
MYKHFLKRFFDIILSLLGVLICLPIILIIAICVKIDSRGPVIFKQQRIGKNGKVFNIYKFRSMCVGAEKTGSGVYSGKGDARVTKVGKFLRATSLDEIPQFFNILFGHMSFIGPRPPLTYHPWAIDKYTPEQFKMFSVRPGITGWAQVHGRKEVEWHRRIELNVWYAEHVSLWLDIKIIFKTVFAVLKNSNNENKGATVEKDNGCLKLMYITNEPSVAKIADEAGVDYLFVDMEYIGKELRQKGDTVKNSHTIKDVKNIKDSLTSSRLLVRCNPIHDKTDEYSSSEEEINAIIDAGADYIMLPYFKTASEVERFISIVQSRVKTVLLFETPEAVENIDEILEIKGIDRIHVGLNDLSLGYCKKFMFELLSDGTVEKLCNKFKEKNIPYGFGGIAGLGKGMVPAELIIKEHYRLGSSGAILSRSFLDVSKERDLSVIKQTFTEEVKKIRELELSCKNNEFDLVKNKIELDNAIDSVIKTL